MGIKYNHFLQDKNSTNNIYNNNNDYMNIKVEDRNKNRQSRQQQLDQLDVEKIKEYRDVMSLKVKPEDRNFSNHELAESYCRNKIDLITEKLENRYYQQECEKHSELLLIKANQITSKL